VSVAWCREDCVTTKESIQCACIMQSCLVTAGLAAFMLPFTTKYWSLIAFSVLQLRNERWCFHSNSEFYFTDCGGQEENHGRFLHQQCVVLIFCGCRWTSCWWVNNQVTSNRARELSRGSTDLRSCRNSCLVRHLCSTNYFKETTSRFAHIEKFSLNFSNLSFVIRVNLLHP